MIRPFACVSRGRRLLPALLFLALLLLALAGWPGPLAAGEDGVALPVVMYHSVLRDPRRAGRYVVSPATVEADLRYLREHGYEAILPRELARAVKKGEPLPEKPVILSFDDGFLNNKTYVLPLLEQYRMKAVIAVVGSYSERFSSKSDPNPAYAHLTWKDIAELEATGLVEIANHSYDMHRQSPRRGSMRKPAESPAEYYAALVEDTARTQSLLEQNAGVLPTTYAYPFGHISPESAPILREMGFDVLLTCTEKVNHIGGDPEGQLSLGRFNRPGDLSTAIFMRRLGIR